MKIIEITRTISGNHWDNVSARAVTEEGENPNKVIVSLDEILRKGLKTISDNESERERLRMAVPQTDDDEKMPF